ncbi:winged helix-turn-helix transcriptional regulator [Bosea lupini]|uniref:winged helix-turn-helix transcriptional regulator n=1 Tax=Bosea lupini TaxID=1036779 RepID=UPI000B82D2CC
MRAWRWRQGARCGISARLLSARLKALEAAGYVERRDLNERVRHVEYVLTARGTRSTQRSRAAKLGLRQVDAMHLGLTAELGECPLPRRPFDVCS